MVPQDVWAFQGVALRSGCFQTSEYNLPEVTFTGNLFNILAAMAYMIDFY